MGVHAATGGHGLRGQIRVGVKLGEILFVGMGAQGKEKRLIPIVAGAPIAGSHGMGEGNLRHFLAIAKDTELGLAAEHFAPADQTELTALEGDAIVIENDIGIANGIALLFYMTYHERSLRHFDGANRHRPVGPTCWVDKRRSRHRQGFSGTSGSGTPVNRGQCTKAYRHHWAHCSIWGRNAKKTDAATAH